jgi:uncharacterized LabA/DUF88 family protein
VGHAASGCRASASSRKAGPEKSPKNFCSTRKEGLYEGYIPPRRFGGRAQSRSKGRLLHIWRPPIRTNIYVDGFNLYYGALRNSRYKWLNLRRLCELLLRPDNEIIQIKCFTARVKARPSDPDQPTRQQMYLRALRTLPGVTIYFGHFLSHPARMPLVMEPGQPQRYAWVIKTEEKGSDVNLATHLLHDAHRERFEVAVVVSNDSDLVGPIKIVREELRKKVGILNPHQKQSVELRKNSDFLKPIGAEHLAARTVP